MQHSHPRPNKYATHVEHKEKFTEALDMVRGGISVQRAAERFNISKSTLHDHLTGKVHAMNQSGPPKLISNNR